MRCGVLTAVAAAAIGCGTGGGTLSGAAGAGTGGDGTIPIPTGSGGGAGAAGSIMTGAAGNGDTCVETRPAVAKLVPDVLIVLDTASSMNDPISSGTTVSKWMTSVNAINANVGSSGTQINWGLSFIASDVDACDAGGIAVPVDSSWGIRDALASHTNGGMLSVIGYRPTRAAINLAAAYLSGRGVGHAPAILLITDGLPGCAPGTSDLLYDDTVGVVRAVGDAFAAGISTYVIGLATSDGSADASLNRIASAGGVARNVTPTYYPASGIIDFMTAMAAVSATADCAFELPPLPSTDGSSSREYIRVMTDSGPILQDAENGWTYTDNTHTGIRLHGSSCDASHAGAPTYVTIICHPGLASP